MRLQSTVIPCGGAAAWLERTYSSEAQSGDDCVRFCFVWCAVTGPKDGFCKVVGHQLPSKTRVTLTRLPAVATVAKCKGELSSSQD